jgi:hypothetical protein
MKMLPLALLMDITAGQWCKDERKKDILSEKWT